MKSIHGYQLLQEFLPRNAGFCMWTFCEKDGHEYFIKQLLDPKYPIDPELYSPEGMERKKKICAEFEEKQNAFIRTLERCRTGNNVIIQDFFREGAKYYLVTDRVYPSDISLQDLALLEEDKKEVLLRSILYSIAALHEQGIVHSDIKKDNILLKKTEDGYITAKIIDFGGSFLTSWPQTGTTGDDVYFSPEALRKSKGEEVTLTTKIDIFALGILFHQYLTGELPEISGGDHYVCTAVLNGNTVTLHKSLSPFYRSLIESMLSLKPEDRPDARELLERFREKNGEGRGEDEKPKPEKPKKVFAPPVDLG